MEKKIKLTAAILIAICLMVILFQVPAKAQTKHIRYHNKLQKERSFDTWEKSQPKIRLKAVKLAVKQSKNTKGKNSQSARLVRKEERIRKQIIK